MFRRSKKLPTETRTRRRLLADGTIEEFDAETAGWVVIGRSKQTSDEARELFSRREQGVPEEETQSCHSAHSGKPFEGPV